MDDLLVIDDTRILCAKERSSVKMISFGVRPFYINGQVGADLDALKILEEKLGFNANVSVLRSFNKINRVVMPKLHNFSLQVA